ncbi:MAG TPA: hypothetical protein VIE65_17400 [Methylobacter sp.]
MFDSSRVAVVDSYNGSVLARGPFPITSSGDFAHAGISQKLGVSNSSFSSIISISLIDCTGESDMLAAECAAFDFSIPWPPSYWPPFLQSSYNPRAIHGTSVKAENGNRYPGGMVWWPIEGVAQGQDASQFLKWPGYNLSGLVDHIRSLLLDPDSRVIYFHCSLGADRTAALAGAYAIRYLGMDFTKALDFISNATPAGPPNANYIRLLEEFWLHEAIRRSMLP